MGGVIAPLLTEPARHIHRLFCHRYYFTYHRLATVLRRVPRFTPVEVRLHGWHLGIPDVASFLSTYREIFVNQLYAFAYDSDAPSILDLGANIGLGVLFFKRMYPRAKIVALEPDPYLFGFLQRNVQGNGFADVTLMEKAVWHEDAALPFYPQGADGGRVVQGLGRVPAGSAIEVEAVDVRKLLSERKVDFLKMDIEGAESAVLPACAPYLSQIRHVFVEYHSVAGSPQRLGELLSLLEGSGFRLSIQEVWFGGRPFLERSVNDVGFDYQANVFATKICADAMGQ